MHTQDGARKNTVVYDVESYPNFFCATLQELDGPPVYYEVSARRNDSAALRAAVGRCGRMIGFNNEHYDWVVLSHLLGTTTDDGLQVANELHRLTEAIICSDDPYKYTIWPNRQAVPQVDLFKINHFDNPSKSTSLKALQIAMRSESVIDLPFKPGTVLSSEGMDIVARYNVHDVSETVKFARICAPAIRFRENIGPHALSYNDTKIGKKFFAAELEKRSPGILRKADGSKRQTVRDTVPVADLILPYIRFERREFQDAVERFRAITVQHEKVKGVYKGMASTVDGFKFRFGAGGLHGSLSKAAVIADGRHQVLDVDVTSFYPRMAIVNKIFPAHIGELFCIIYDELFGRRAQHAKGTDENAILKLALNGVFGDTGSRHSEFRDIAYMLKICINGQLLLCMLAEQLMKIPGMQIVQANTDGLTLYFPRSERENVERVCAWWQWYTALTLEYADYSRMWVRDVNSYLAQRTDGKVKRKGPYEYELDWYQDPSALVVPRAAEAALLYDHDPADFIAHHDDPWDFLLRVKVPRSSRLMHGDQQVQNTTRYYVSTDGQPLVKIMPPLPRTPDKWRTIGVHAEALAVPFGTRKNYRCSICGHGATFMTKKDFKVHNIQHHTRKTTVCNRFTGDLSGIDLGFYRSEVEKLLF